MEFEDAFNELIGELKVLNMKAEDGFVKKKKKKKTGSEVVIRGGVQCPAVAKQILKISPKWQKFQNFGEIFKQ